MRLTRKIFSVLLCVTAGALIPAWVWGVLTLTGFALIVWPEDAA